MAVVPTVIPPAGTPGKFDPRNPTLIPNFDRNMISVGTETDDISTVNHSSPAGFLATSPRAAATAVATIGGTVTTGDEVTLELLNSIFPGGLISHTYTTVGGDTVSTIALALAALFDADPVASAYDIELSVAAGAAITVSQGGPIGNFTTLASPNAEPAKVTIAGTALTGDQIAILFSGPNIAGGSVLITRAVTTGDTATTSAAALVASINANAALIAAGVTAANTAGVITFTVPAGVQPVTITSWVNTAAPTATITGTVAAADTINLVFTGAGIVGSPVTVSYTALLGDTVTSVAAGLAAAINGNAALSVAGLSATNTAGVVNVAGMGGNTNGQVRITSSVSPGSETVTITTAPTTTSTVGTNATETVTFTPSNGVMSGGTGPVVATNNFEFAPAAGGISAFYYGQPYQVGYEVLQQMVAQGMPII